MGGFSDYASKRLVNLADGPGTDAAGRLRVSTSENLFDIKFLGGQSGSLAVDTSISGAGINIINPTVGRPYQDVESTAGVAGSVIRQSLRRFNHQPGKAQRIEMAGVMRLTESGKGVVKRIGFYDENNGAFFEDTEAGMGVVTRSNDSGSPVDVRIEQTNWNKDQMDGSRGTRNPSREKLNWDKVQTMGIDFADTLSGRIRFFVKIGGRTIIVHQVDVGNILTVPAFGTSNLPVRYELITTAQSPPTSMRTLSASVSSEGPQNSSGTVHSAGTSFPGVTVTDVTKIYALLGVRLQADCTDCDFELQTGSILSTSNKNYEVMLIQNATVLGTFDYVDKPDSVVQIAIGDAVNNPSENVVTGGRIPRRIFGAGNSAANLTADRTLALGVAADGKRDEIVFAVRPLEMGASTFFGSFGWRESY